MASLRQTTPCGRASRGFTLVELMVVIAVIAILSLIALPSYLDSIVRRQIADALPLADVAKPAIQAAARLGAPLPPDNAAAGLPEPDKMVSNLVSSVTVQDGAIHLQFGNNANGTLKGKTLSLRPAVVEGAPVVPVAWICGMAKVPDKMTVRGTNRTDIPTGLLPLSCR
ncbi:MAG: pilin [Ramlibacter sp.]|nr:pilin [Ramlibacter sp.]MBX3659286.1 pilin [Ramlibacter sp.]